jgi:hypothetical protein
MYIPGMGIETSSRHIPLTEESLGTLVEARPLYDLADRAPQLPNRPYRPRRIVFAFSNDELGASLPSLQARTLLPEYRAASNRVALLVGESSLTSSIRYMPEDTIIFVDENPDMCLYMERYVANMLEASSPIDWISRMALNDNNFMRGKEGYFARQLIAQVDEWKEAGTIHAMSNANEFKAAQQALSKKTFIPWRGNLLNSTHMNDLAQALNSRGASITFMNLTNVVPYVGARTSNRFVQKINMLPITPNAPILTTNVSSRYPRDFQELIKVILGKGIPIAQATGPFFGLESLANDGGRLVPPALGAIMLRGYTQVDTSGRSVEAVLKDIIAGNEPDPEEVKRLLGDLVIPKTSN